MQLLWQSTVCQEKNEADFGGLNIRENMKLATHITLGQMISFISCFCTFKKWLTFTLSKVFLQNSLGFIKLYQKLESHITAQDRKKENIQKKDEYF